MGANQWFFRPISERIHIFDLDFGLRKAEKSLSPPKSPISLTPLYVDFRQFWGISQTQAKFQIDAWRSASDWLIFKKWRFYWQRVLDPRLRSVWKHFSVILPLAIFGTGSKWPMSLDRIFWQQLQQNKKLPCILFLNVVLLFQYISNKIGKHLFQLVLLEIFHNIFYKQLSTSRQLFHDIELVRMAE